MLHSRQIRFAFLQANHHLALQLDIDQMEAAGERLVAVEYVE